jgi:hypothetical protein
MATQDFKLNIMWSVWDSNPLVSWSWSGGTSSVTMKMSPIAVAHLAKRHMIAIVGNYDDLGSYNLLFYSYAGELIKAYSAPSLGKDSRFGAIRESDNDIEVLVGYLDGDHWVEMAGELNLDDGVVSKLHRSY